MAIAFKQSVATQVPLVRMLACISQAYAEHEVVATITSLNDSKHKAGSLHYADRAVDVRTWNIPGQPNPSGPQPGATCASIVQRLRALLGSDYQVVFERDLPNGRVQHIHVEHDPLAKPA